MPLITEVEAHLAESRRSEAKCRSLLVTAPDAIIVNSGGDIVLVSVQAKKLCAIPEPTWSGSPYDSLVPQRFRAGLAHRRDACSIDPHTRGMGADLEL